MVVVVVYVGCVAGVGDVGGCATHSPVLARQRTFAVLTVCSHVTSRAEAMFLIPGHFPSIQANKLCKIPLFYHFTILL